jgi:hypothetical protein
MLLEVTRRGAGGCACCGVVVVVGNDADDSVDDVDFFLRFFLPSPFPI